MSHQNPQVESPTPPSGDDAIQPNAPDFVETPEVAPIVPEQEHLPLWLFLVCGFVLFLVGSSFTGFEIFGRDMLDQGPGGPIASSSTAAAAEAPATPMDLGKKIYGQNCANCHQASGEGQPGSYPPLAGSEWVLGSKERLAAILLKGLQGPITVKGASFGTQAMPAQESVLTPEKIADLMTYLRGTWGNTAGAVAADDVTAAKTKFTSRTSAWSQEDLQKLPATDPADKK